MTDLVKDFQTTFGDRAQRIDADWRKDRAGILADGNLSDQGKQAALGKANEARQSAVERLQSEAELWVSYETKSAHEELAKAKAATAKNRRAILGDALIADLERRRFSLLTPDELIAAVDTAPDDWHRVLYGELVEMELRGRAHSGDNAAQAALGSFAGTIPADVMELSQTLTEFENQSGAILSQLDVTAHKEQLAVTFGVNADYIETGD